MTWADVKPLCPAICQQAVEEKYQYSTDNRTHQTSALICLIPPQRLTDKRGSNRADDA